MTKIAIFADVHGNLPALEQFIRSTRGRVDGYLCLGDVVDCGPWNDECIEIVSALPNITLIEGNHERFFVDPITLEDKSQFLKGFYAWSVTGFTRKDLITDLPQSLALDGYNCVHTIDDRRVYQDTEIDVDRNYFLAHTHVQFRIQRTGHTIINCGSIGQNRHDIAKLNYVIFDLESKHSTFCEETYPVEKFFAELRSRKCPVEFYDYLAKFLHA